MLRTILPHGAKVGIARALCAPRVGRAVAVLTRDRVPSRGIRVDTGYDAVSPATKASIFWGFYESAEIRLIKAHFRPDLDVVELGASLGITGAHASRVARGRRYLAVEANESLVPVLTANVPGAVVRTCAVAAGPGLGDTATFHVGGSTEGSSLAPRAGTIARTEVTRRTLSELLAEEGFGDYQLICDIEGAEAGLFAHDAAAFDRCRLMVVELHANRDERRLSIDDLVAMAHALGFTRIARDGSAFAFARER